jgi:flagellin
MSSILTNNGAMVALQTLKGINANLARTQNEISTGKSVATSKDNAAIWAISKTMESDVSSFRAVDQTLAIGESTVGTARAAAESITDLLGKIKTKVIAAQEAGTSAEDRAKIQTDIDALKEQIGSVVKSAQFNGKNLIDGTTTSPMKVTSSLDRGASGTVNAGTIDVETADLRSYAMPDFDGGGTAADGASAVNVSAALTFQGGGTALAASDVAADGSDVTGLLAGDTVALTVNGTSFSYTVAEGDDAAAVLAGLNAAKTTAGIGGTLAEASGVLTFDAGTGAGDFEVSTSVGRGGLSALAGLDVTAEGGAASALAAMEGLIKVAVDSAASFGSSQGRIETQRDFIGKLTDSMRSGIGALVDADMEEVSARLQALQVQQQLGTQSLSIANQAPQALLSLFR